MVAGVYTPCIVPFLNCNECRALQKADTGDTHHTGTPVYLYPPLLSLLSDTNLFEANGYSVRLLRVSTMLHLFVQFCEGDWETGLF